MTAPLRVGDTLYGYCGGWFGRDSYGDKTVEAIGSGWVVVRSEYGWHEFGTGNPEDLIEYLERPANDDDE